MKDEFSDDIKIRVKDKDCLCLFISQFVCRRFVKPFWKKYTKMNKLYKEGSERINNDLNIVSMLKRLRNFEHFLEL